ncbi:MAG TPA: POTRA domain-containing protein, partial [Rhodocyclaceae bacterium]
MARWRVAPIIQGLILSTCFASTWSWCQSPSSAPEREFIRQQERERILRQQQEQVPDVRLEGPKARGEDGLLPAKESPCFNIDRLLLVGDAAESFQWALAAANATEDGVEDPAVPRCLGSGGINLAMRRIQNAIIGRGYITTRILAQPQDLNGGTLTLTVIPGRIRSIRLADGTDGRATLWNAMP